MNMDWLDFLAIVLFVAILLGIAAICPRGTVVSYN